MNNNITRTIVLNKDHMEFINDTHLIATNNTLDIYDVFLFPSHIPKYSKHIGLNSSLSDVAEFIKSLFMSWSLSETRNIFFETLESRIPENTPE